MHNFNIAGLQQLLGLVIVLVLQSCGGSVNSQFIPGQVVEPASIRQSTNDMQQARGKINVLSSDELMQRLGNEMQRINGNSSEVKRLEDNIIEEVTRHEKCVAGYAFVRSYSETLKGWKEAVGNTLNACNVFDKLFVFELEKTVADIVCETGQKDSPQDFEFFSIQAAKEFFQAGVSFGLWRLAQDKTGELFIQTLNFTCRRFTEHRDWILKWLQVGISQDVLRAAPNSALNR